MISFGYELCRSDGNEAWLFQDIATGMDSSYPNHLTLIDNQIIMIADDVAEGGQIYVVDSDSLVCHSIQSQIVNCCGHGSIWYYDSMAYYCGFKLIWFGNVCLAGLVIERGLDSDLISPIVFTLPAVVSIPDQMLS